MDAAPGPGVLLGAAWELAEGVGSCTGCFTATVAAAVVVTCVPLTHGVGGRLLFGGAAWTPRSTFARGGASFITFQVLSWSFWGAALLAALGAGANLVAAFAHAALPTTVLAGAAVCGSVLSEVLMVSSLLTFQEAPAPGGKPAAAAAARNHRRAASESLSYDFGWDSEDDDSDAQATPSPSDASPPAPAAAAAVPSPQRHRRSASAAVSRAFPPFSPRVSASAAAPEAVVVTVLEALRGHAGAALIICLCVVLSLTGHGLVASVALEAVVGTPARMLFVTIAMVCIIIAGPVTHGLAGRLKHQKSGEWRFFQPWRGGVAFVAAQGLGWALYSISLVAFFVAFWGLLAEGYAWLNAACVPLTLLPELPRWAARVGLIGGALTGRPVPDARVVLPATFWVAGVTGVAAQVVLAVSLIAYRAPLPKQPAAAAAPPAPAVGARGHAAMMAVVLMVYAPCHLLVAAVASLYLVASPTVASAALAVAAGAYARTYAGHPGHTGARTWPRFRAYCQSVLSVALSRWFGTVRVLRPGPAHPGGADAPPTVFGYHPHGMYPAAAAWFHLTPQWRAAFPDVSPVTMGASAIFWTPMLRDVVMWSGARIVSRIAVRRALHAERRPIVLCPGGQAELVEHRAGAATVLCTRHKGFIKCALEAGAPVCPIFVFGESQAQRNLLSVKRLQRWTAKKLGFPFPFIPGGYMRVLPLPEPRPLTFVVGPRIEGPPRPDPAAPVTDAEVDAVHAAYYAALVALFEAHKAAAGFPEATLVLKHD